MFIYMKKNILINLMPWEKKNWRNSAHSCRTSAFEITRLISRKKQDTGEDWVTQPWKLNEQGIHVLQWIFSNCFVFCKHWNKKPDTV